MLFRSTLIDDTLVTIGQVNPSLQVYQKFNLTTQELITELYGYGFTEAEGDVIYVQAPQHFSGISGLNRIFRNNGTAFYESGENVIIQGDLQLDGNIHAFCICEAPTNAYKHLMQTLR